MVVILVGLVVLFAFLSGVLTLAFTLQGRRLTQVKRSYSTIPLRNDFRKQMVRKAPREILMPRFLDDTSILYVSGKNLYRMSVRDGSPEIEFRGHGSDINDFDVSPDGERIVTASSDGTLRLWKAVSGECLAVSERLDTLDQPSWTMLHDIVWQRNGRTLMSADMWGIKTWSGRDLKLLSKAESDYFYLCNGLLSPDGRTVSSPVTSEAEQFSVYDLRSGETFYHLHDMEPIQYDKNGKRLLVVCREKGKMEIWDICPEKAWKQYSYLWLNCPEGPLNAACLSPDGKELVSAHADGTVRIWNARYGAEREVLHWEERETDGVTCTTGAKFVMAVSNKSGEYCLWGPFIWVY